MKIRDTVNITLEEPCKSCMFKDLHIETEKITDWGGSIVQIICTISCEHIDVCKYLSDAKNEHGGTK